MRRFAISIAFLLLVALPISALGDKDQFWAPEAVWMAGNPKQLVVHFSGLNAKRSPEAVAAAQRKLRKTYKHLQEPTLVSLLWDRHLSPISGVDDLARILDTPVAGIELDDDVRVAMVGEGRGVTQIKVDSVLFPGRVVAYRARIGPQGPEPFVKTKSAQIHDISDTIDHKFVVNKPVDLMFHDNRFSDQGKFVILKTDRKIRHVTYKTKNNVEKKMSWWTPEVSISRSGELLTTRGITKLTIRTQRKSIIIDGQKIKCTGSVMETPPSVLRMLYGLEKSISQLTLEKIEGTWKFSTTQGWDLRRLLGAAPAGVRGPKSLGARAPFHRGTLGYQIDVALTAGIKGLEEMLREQLPADKNRRLTIYTLLRCREVGRGSDFSHAEMKKLWLKTRGDKDKVYQKALDVMIAAALIRLEDNDAQLHTRLNKDFKWLMNSAKKKDNKIWWAYPAGRGDLSNTQFAVLAVDAALSVGIKPDKGFWSKVLLTYASLREPDPKEVGPSIAGDGGIRRQLLEKSTWPKLKMKSGEVSARGWGYDAMRPGSRTSSMTCAGIVAVALALHHGTGELTIEQKKTAKILIRESWAAVGKDFDPSKNPGGPDRWWSYGLYAMERAGAFSGVTTVGGVDWYVAGAEVLLKARRDKGWYLEYSPEVDTSFSVLFLLRDSKPLDVLKTGVGKYEIK